jgi:hypothetical protein
VQNVTANLCLKRTSQAEGPQPKNHQPSKTARRRGGEAADGDGDGGDDDDDK